MEFLTALWLPIILTAIVLFFASFIAWTILPHHESDFKKLDQEDQLMEFVRGLNAPAGNYMFPFMSHADQKDSEKIEKYKTGPRGTLVMWDYPNMGRNLGLTFLYFLVIAVVTAYIAWSALGGALAADIRFMKAFQITGAIGVLVFASSGTLNSVWFRRRVLTDVIDGIVYGVIMGLLFGFLWPALVS